MAWFLACKRKYLVSGHCISIFRSWRDRCACVYILCYFKDCCHVCSKARLSFWLYYMHVVAFLGCQPWLHLELTKTQAAGYSCDGFFFNRLSGKSHLQSGPDGLLGVGVKDTEERSFCSLPAWPDSSRRQAHPFTSIRAYSSGFWHVLKPAQISNLLNWKVLDSPTTELLNHIWWATLISNKSPLL